MKVASLALVLIATTKASLFEDDEDFGLQEEREEFEEDRFQQLAESESDPDLMLEQVNVDDEDNQQVEGTGVFGKDDQPIRRRGKGRRSRGRGKGKGRRGRKNRKQRKGTFDIQKFLDKLETKEAKMEAKLDAKCDKKLGWGEKICSQLAGKTDCQQWALAQEVKCQAYGSCRIDNMQDKGKCMGEFMHKMKSLMSDKVDTRPSVSDEDIGQCFTDVLIEAKTCSDTAAAQYQTAMQGVAELTEQEMETAKAALKEQRQLKRQQRKAQRKGRNNRRGNNRRGGNSRRGRRSGRGQNNIDEDEEEFQPRGRGGGRGGRGGRNGRGQDNNDEEEEEFQPRGRRGGRGGRGQNNYDEDEEEFQPRGRRGGRGNRRSNNNQYEQEYEGQAQDEVEYVPHRFT